LKPVSLLELSLQVVSKPVVVRFKIEALVGAAGRLKTVNDSEVAVPFSVVIDHVPVVAPVGTGTTIEVSDHDVGVAKVLFREMVDEPWVSPKETPVIVTSLPTVPEVTEMDEIEVDGIGIADGLYRTSILERLTCCKPLEIRKALNLNCSLPFGKARIFELISEALLLSVTPLVVAVHVEPFHQYQVVPLSLDSWYLMSPWLSSPKVSVNDDMELELRG